MIVTTPNNKSKKKHLPSSPAMLTFRKAHSSMSNWFEQFHRKTRASVTKTSISRRALSSDLAWAMSKHS